MKKLEHLLSHPLYQLHTSATMAEATELMQQSGTSSLLVIDPDSPEQPAGIITERDVLKALAADMPADALVSDVMSKPVVVAPASTEFRDGYHLLAFHNIRHLLLLDDNGNPQGIISESDFRKHLSSNFISRLKDIRGVMSSSALAVPRHTLLRSAIQTMASHHFTCVVATDNDLPCGILTENDAVKFYNSDRVNNSTQLDEVMVKPVRTIPDNTSVPLALESMQRHNIRHLVVVDQSSKVLGLVTEHDIVHQIEIEFAGEMRRQRQLNESELKRYEHKLQAIFDTTNIFLALLDLQGCVLEINAAALKMSGYSRSEVLLNPIWETVWRCNDSSQAERLRQVLAATHDGKTSRLDTQHLDSRQQVRYCDCRFQPILNENGEVDYILVEGLDVTDLKFSQQQLKHLAFYDPLTNLPNRTLLSERMQVALQMTRENGKLLVIGYLDLDHFKPVNDRLGHDVGDQLLIEVANRLRHASRAHDTIARLGGDEFVLLLPSHKNRQEAEASLKRILNRIAAPYRLHGNQIAISASLGYTLFPDDDCDADMLLRHADQAMYAAKQQGRNCYYLFDSEQNSVQKQRQELIRQAAQSLRDGDFELHYQPKVNMKTGQVLGAEALLRWQHPERGLLSPNEFLPLLNGDHLMAELEEWVLQQGIRQLHEWHLHDLRLTLSINVSGQFLQESGFVDKLSALLALYPTLPTSALELEILETTALENITRASEIIRRCRARGVGFALDDFGTGYSSLTHLKRLPADSIKIDCSFVADIIDDPDNLAIVEGIIGLATAFRLNTVAEGVEKIEQGLMLLHLGCEVAQGYAIAAPMPAGQFPLWVRQFTLPEEWSGTITRPIPIKNFPLLAASVDHRSWVSRILAYVNLETHEVIPSDVQDHINCRFGQWLNGDGRVHFGHTQRWQEVDKIHKAIHAQSAQMVVLASQGKHAQAQRLAPSLIAQRDELLNHLTQWYADELQPV